MPRTTIDLDPTVLEELRARGRREAKSIGTVASELLAAALHEATSTGPPPARFELQSHRMGRPRVDLEDKDALWAILDGRD